MSALSVESLLSKARQVPKVGRPVCERSPWARLYPVFCELRERGYTYRQAIDWLIAQGAIAPEDAVKAGNGFTMLTFRRSKSK